MPEYNWAVLINLNDFDALNVPDYTFSRILEGMGRQTFRVCKGILYSLVVDSQYLTVGLNGRNGFNMNERSAYIDEQRNLWVGYAA